MVKIKENDIPMGMCTQYSKLIKDHAMKFSEENDRVKTPIIGFLGELVNSYEMRILGNHMLANEMHCIYDLKINLNKLSVKMFTVDIQKLEPINQGSFDVTMGECNKNFIKFIQSFEKEFGNDEERFVDDMAIFIEDLKVQTSMMEEFKKGMFEEDDK